MSKRKSVETKFAELVKEIGIVESERIMAALRVVMITPAAKVPIVHRRPKVTAQGVALGAGEGGNG